MHKIAQIRKGGEGTRWIWDMQHANQNMKTLHFVRAPNLTSP